MSSSSSLSYSQIKRKEKAHADSATRQTSGRPKTPHRQAKLRLSQALRQLPSAHDGKRISVVEKYVTDVDELHERFTDIEVLFLSHNLVSTLQGFTQFPFLRVLSLAANTIKDVEELHFLSAMPSLENLNLEENPVTFLPYYRSYAIKFGVSLRTLDNRPVKDGERQEADSIVHRCEESLKLMFGNHFLALKLESIVRRIKLHAELIDVVYGRLAAFNRCEMPSAWSINTKKFLQMWDFEADISTAEVRFVYSEFRQRIVDAKLAIARGGKQPPGKTAYEMFKALAEDDSPPKMTQSEMWEKAIKDVLVDQQHRITQLLADVDLERTKAEQSSAVTFKQFGALSRIRQAAIDNEQQTRREREAVIRELRQEVTRLNNTTAVIDATHMGGGDGEYVLPPSTIKGKTATTRNRQALSTVKRVTYQTPIGSGSASPSMNASVSVRPRHLSPDFAQPSLNSSGAMSEAPREPPMPVPLMEEGTGHNFHHMQPPVPLQQSPGSGKRGQAPDSHGSPKKGTQLTPAKDPSGLRVQVMLLQQDIDRRVAEEQRLKQLNEELLDRLMTTESRNDSNIDAAVKEVADLKQSLEQMAKEKAELGSTVDRLQGDLAAIVGDDGAEGYVQQLRKQLEETRKVNDELRNDIRQIASEGLDIRARADHNAQELKYAREAVGGYEKAAALKEVIHIKQTMRNMLQAWLSIRKRNILSGAIIATFGKNVLMNSFSVWRRRCLLAKCLRRLLSSSQRATVAGCLHKWAQLRAAVCIGDVRNNARLCRRAFDAMHTCTVIAKVKGHARKRADDHWCISAAKRFLRQWRLESRRLHLSPALEAALTGKAMSFFQGCLSSRVLQGWRHAIAQANLTKHAVLDVVGGRNSRYLLHRLLSKWAESTREARRESLLLRTFALQTKRHSKRKHFVAWVQCLAKSAETAQHTKDVLVAAQKGIHSMIGAFKIDGPS